MKRSVLGFLITILLAVGVVAAACTEAAPTAPVAPAPVPKPTTGTGVVPATPVVPGGPFVGGSGPGYPTGPLDMSIKADLSLNDLGQVKGAAGQEEVKGRLYEGTGAFSVAINGASLVANKVTVTSNLKFKGETAQHQGKIDIEVNAPAEGHIALEYLGTASRAVDPVTGDIAFQSGGNFKTTKMSGAWAKLVSDGTYVMTINERDGTLGKKVTVRIDTMSTVSASAAVGGPFVGVPGPGYPTGPLDMNTGTVSLLLNRVGQVKAQGDKLEVKDRQYEGTGSFQVTINGAVFNATEIKVVSNLKLTAGSGDHQGTIDVDIDVVPGGHITLDYNGTATKTGSIIVSRGTFKTSKTTGAFAGLVAEGTYDLNIDERGDTVGSVAMVTIITRSASAPPSGGAGGQLKVSVVNAQLKLAAMGQVKQQGGQITEIRDRKYQGTGTFPVSINDTPQTASEISIGSSLANIVGGVGEHHGTLVIRVVGVGNLDLAYKGSAQVSTNTIKSSGTFKMTKTGDNFLGLASAEGTYEITINESAATLDAPVTVSFSIPAGPATVPPGGPFVGGSGPGYPTGPLNMDTGAVSLLLNRVGQVKAQGNKFEVKGRQYEEALGSLFQVTINGATLNATGIKVISNLSLDAGTGSHQGTIDVDNDVPIGADPALAYHITLEYQGTATMTGSTITSTGTFKTVKGTGLFAGLVADGTYSMTIVESGQIEGSSVTVTISTRSGVQSAPPPPPAGQPPAGGGAGQPPAGAITVKTAQYDTAKQKLQVELTDSRALAQTVTVSVTSTGQTIGTLTDAGAGKFKGDFSWPVNPQNITIASNLGWSVTATVTAK